MDLIRIKNLAVGYPGEAPVVSGIDLTIGDRDYIGVIGPNGGGKTTFIRTLVGALPPLEGRIERIGGRVETGYLPQIKSIDRNFPISVEEVVLSGLAARKGLFGRYGRKDRARAVELLGEIDIGKLSRRSIGELSGGELQRVLLCRALISDPQLLILDEPTTFVDNRFEKELYELLAELNQRMAIVMVAHDLGTVSRYVKSMACINRCFHYHPSNTISAEQLTEYDCPIQLISHGPIPHTVLRTHDGCTCCSGERKTFDTK
ncbi:MAG: ABC transporter ATP-binding protein [Rikenella sp.]|nr:ABC transporter ATP-binding protein [Rikenella sp.]